MAEIEYAEVELCGKKVMVVVRFYECQGLWEVEYEDEIGVGTTFEGAVKDLEEILKEDGKYEC